jgi:hypothetical protein
MASLGRVFSGALIAFPFAAVLGLPGWSASESQGSPASGRSAGVGGTGGAARQASVALAEIDGPGR